MKYALLTMHFQSVCITYYAVVLLSGCLEEPLLDQALALMMHAEYWANRRIYSKENYIAVKIIAAYTATINNQLTLILPE